MAILPDTVDEVYAQVIEQYSEQRKKDMKSLASVLVQDNDLSPDDHMAPSEQQDSVNPFVIAKFGSWRGFCENFGVMVCQTISGYVETASKSNMIDVSECARLRSTVDSWLDIVNRILKDIGKNAERCNAEFTSFCVRAKIGNLWQREDLFFKEWGFSSEAVDGVLVSVELDLEVISRLMASDISNAMFGGDTTVVKNGRTKTVSYSDSIVDLL